MCIRDSDITKRTAEEHKAIKDGTYVPTYGGTYSYLSESQKDDSATFSKKRNQSHYALILHFYDTTSNLWVKTIV